MRNQLLEVDRLAVLVGLDRLARRDLTEDAQLGLRRRFFGFGAVRIVEDLDATSSCPQAEDRALALEVGQVLVNRDL